MIQIKMRLVKIMLKMNVMMMMIIKQMTILNRLTGNNICECKCYVGVCASEIKAIDHSCPDAGTLQGALPPGNDCIRETCHVRKIYILLKKKNIIPFQIQIQIQY